MTLYRHLKLNFQRAGMFPFRIFSVYTNMHLMSTKKCASTKIIYHIVEPSVLSQLFPTLEELRVPFLTVRAM